MDTLGLSTQLKVRQCSQCQGDTEFYCNTCKRGLCLQCKEKHLIDLGTKHHDVVIYREKFEYLPKQEPALLYDARKQQVGNEQLELTSTPVLHTSVCVTGVRRVFHISRVMSDRVWVSDYDNNLILTDTTGDTIHRVTDIITLCGVHTVNSSGELIYIDRKHNINKLSTDNKTVTTLIQRPSLLYPQCVHCSPSTGDLMVGLFNYRTGKVTRYSNSGQHILTIEHDNTGHTLYSEPLYLTENNNGDIIVSDWDRVVVTERGGRHRFSYTGPPSGSSLYPREICTDALSHILVCDVNTNTIQMIDKDGHFLSLLLTRQHGINRPYGLNYDDKTHLLWVGSAITNTVSVYKYLQRRYSLTDDSVDDEKKIFKFTDDTNILEDTSEKTELELMLSRTGKEKKDKIPISADIIADDSVDDDDRIFKSTDDTKILEDTSEKPQLELMLSRNSKEKKDMIPISAEIIPDDQSLFIKPTSTALEKKLLVYDDLLQSTFNPSFHPSLPVSDYQSPFPTIGPLEKRHAISEEHRGIKPRARIHHGIHRNKPRIHSFTPVLDNQSPFPTIGPLKKRHAISEEHREIHRIKPRIHSFSPDMRGISISAHRVSVDMKESEKEAKLGSWSTINKPLIRSHGKRQLHSSDRLEKTQKAEKKRASFLRGKTKKYPYTMTEEMITFNKKLEQLRENGEADIRIDLLVNSLNIETKFRKLCRSETINKAYVEFICNLEYLDCVDLGVGITMKPSNQYIKPFYGRRVNDFLGWMKDCAKVLGKTRSTQWGSVSSILFAIYAKKAILEFKPTEHLGIIDYSMRCAMENENYLLAFEIVRTYVFNHVIQLQRIFKDTKGVSPLIIDTILQTSRKMILRKFPNLQNNAIVLSFCWECGQGILTRMVMIISYKGSIEITDRIPDIVMGFKVVLYNLAHLSDEAENVFKSIPVSNKTPLPTVTESEARELFRKHSNLTMISASPYKSIGYSKGRHIVVEKLCISLFCFHKGYIPFGEERFPKQLGGFEVDVQEGYSVLGSGASLEIGGYICRAGCGSIGGFVDLPNNKTGLITCAHVIFSSKELEELESNGIPPGIEVKAFDRTAHTYKVCGTCVAAEFPKCLQQATSPQPNVDAALIELDPVINTFRLRTVSSDQLYSTGFDPDNPPVFSGEVVPLSDPDPVHRICRRIPDTLDSVVKYGVETGLTIGDLYHSGVHVRLISDSLKLPDSSQSAIMCDQIEIQNFPQGQFFECGDSGSFVFCINPDKTLSCLGMAVGLSLPQKTCLVTPIGRILHSVCPPGAQLKPCSSLFDQTRTNAPPQATLDMILTAIGHFQTSLQTVERNVERKLQTSLQSVETNFQASLQTVERNFQTSLQSVETNFQASLQNAERNLQASLQSTETNFQASLQNVKTEVRTLQSQVQQIEDSKTRTSSDQSNANQN